MLGARQLDDGRKCFLPLLILALLLFPGLALSALLLFPGLAFFAFFLALLLVFAFTPLFLCAVQFTSGLARRALVGADDGLDHLLELGDLDAVLLGDVGKVEHPLDNRQLCQPLNLDSQATGLLLGVGEGDDFVVWGRFARIVHGSLAPPARG